MRWLAIAVLLMSGFPFSSDLPPRVGTYSGYFHTLQRAIPPQLGCRNKDSLSRADFEAVMKIVSDARQEGDARRAAECFTQDAVYSSPPVPAHVGRDKLFELFGGLKGSTMSAKIEWHHLVFDPEQQLGAAEFTQQYHLQTHGTVIVKFSHGLISNWREYDVPSDLSWQKFVGINAF